jgi:sugar fermentation stimulation protein A
VARPNPFTQFKPITFPELIPGTLIRRYNRFLADVRLQDGRVVTAHCPNTGSMQGCSEPGRPVYLSQQNAPRRQLKYTWELIEMPTSLVGIHTLVPNRLVFESAKAGRIPEIGEYDDIRREVKVGDGSRIDLMLTNGDRDRCYIEIKNCTLVEKEVALFPDAVTTRGLKHIHALQTLVVAGYRCVMFYVIQRMDAKVFRPAVDIDPDYGRGLRGAVKKGIEVLAYDATIELTGIRSNLRIPFEL